MSRNARTLVGADRTNALEVEAEVGSRVLNILEEPPYTGRPLVNPRDGDRRRVQLDVLRATSQIGGDVAGVHRRNRALHDLHVLLRHRLIPLAGRFDGFGVVLVERGRDHLCVADLPDQARVRDPFPFHAAASAFGTDVMPHDDLAS